MSPPHPDKDDADNAVLSISEGGRGGFLAFHFALISHPDTFMLRRGGHFPSQSLNVTPSQKMSNGTGL